MSLLITLLMVPTSLCRNLLSWVFNTCNNNLAIFAVWTGAYDRGHFRWGSNVNGKGCLIECQDRFYVINYSNLVIKTIGRDLSTGQTVEHTQINCPGVCLRCHPCIIPGTPALPSSAIDCYTFNRASSEANLVGLTHYAQAHRVCLPDLGCSWYLCQNLSQN